MQARNFHGFFLSQGYMGTVFSKMNSYFEFSNGTELGEYPKQVFGLAEKSLQSIVESKLPKNLSHLIAATTTPDTLAPSLAQMIVERFSSSFSNCHSIDIVQGCAGSVTSLILGCQLAELNKSSVMVVHSDAAKKATSRTSRINKIFGNGSFACLISYQDSNTGLIYSKSRQYKGLSGVVSIPLGHDALEIIMEGSNSLHKDPRKYLGLSMNNLLALKLIRHAESFYLDFIKVTGVPDTMILHQVNPLILKHLNSVFRKYNFEFINMVENTGNCGVASIGIVLNSIKDSIKGKRVLICSFGTGGVITAGYWQN
jgi:3-oxoacyl-[acyl-carrier-protein] synthase III